MGPILGGACGAFCFQFIFNVQRPRASIKDMEANMSMVNNSEEDMIDDLERVKQYRSNMMQVPKHIRFGNPRIEIHYLNTKFIFPNIHYPKFPIHIIHYITNIIPKSKLENVVASKQDAGTSCQMNQMHAQ